MNKRNPGIDLLRIFAMGMIVLHHLLSHGGLLFAFPDFSPSGLLMHLLNAFSRCAVNTYVLISGYVMVQSRFRPSRLMALWLQVVFYGALAALCLPLMKAGVRAGADDWLNAFLPVSRNSYWFFTCYAGVFCLSPFLNLFIRHTTRRQAVVLVGTLFLLFSLLPAVTLSDPFRLGNGYHTGWLLVLYLLGACIRQHHLDSHIRQRTALAVFAVCGVLGWAYRLGALALGFEQHQEILLHYTAPTMLLCALSLLVLFRKLRVSDRSARLIALVSPLTFGVYLIHDNPLVREHLIHMRMVPISGYTPVLMLACLLGCLVGLYALCLMMEWLRARLFALLRVPGLCQRGERLLFAWTERCFPGEDA